VLDAARTAAAETSQHAYHSEQRRLDAELLSCRGESAGAEAAFRDALASARRQSARSLELRAARGLAQLLAAAGRSDEARDILQPAVAGLTEGHGTADYQLAAGLLASLS
jgi:ATP/maltotriose-dependent transcriptional regulator MalT